MYLSPPLIMQMQTLKNPLPLIATNRRNPLILIPIYLILDIYSKLSFLVSVNGALLPVLAPKLELGKKYFVAKKCLIITCFNKWRNYFNMILLLKSIFKLIKLKHDLMLSEKGIYDNIQASK